MYIFESDRDFSNGEISFEIRSEDDDALGFVMNYRNPDDFSLWSINSQRPYRALAVKKDDSYRVAGAVEAGYTVKKWHHVRFVLQDGKVTVFFDDRVDFSIKTPASRGGKIGFYSWANSGSQFRNLRFKRTPVD